MWRCSSILERSYECNKKGSRFILELFGEADKNVEVLVDAGEEL